MFTRHFILSLLFGTLLFITACSKSDESDPCASADLVLSEQNVCLLIEHEGLTDARRDQLEKIWMEGMAMIDALMPIDGLLVRAVNNPELVIPEIGVGGYNPSSGEVIIAVNANLANLETILEENFFPILAHEVHHAKRRRSVGYGNTLLQAVVSEGLADHFSIEVTGIAPPPWSVALSGDTLQQWIDTASQSWNQTYNHSAWFLGADSSIPRWTGYSIGFELVNNYLIAHPGQMPSALHNEPASTFLP